MPSGRAPHGTLSKKGDTQLFLFLMVFVIAILLVGAAENSWNLLLGLATAKRRESK
jgi:hypothetical protein